MNYFGRFYLCKETLYQPPFPFYKQILLALTPSFHLLVSNNFLIIEESYHFSLTQKQQYALIQIHKEYVQKKNHRK
jgi:hypothetical protein